MGCAPKVRFALDSLLEGGGFEPSVPLYGELGALGRVRRDPRRHREARNARSVASTRSPSDLLDAWGWTKPRARSASATSSIWRRPCSPSRQGSRSVGTIGLSAGQMPKERTRAGFPDQGENFPDRPI